MASAGTSAALSQEHSAYGSCRHFTRYSSKPLASRRQMTRSTFMCASYPLSMGSPSASRRRKRASAALESRPSSSISSAVFHTERAHEHRRARRALDRARSRGGLGDGCERIGGIDERWSCARRGRLDAVVGVGRGGGCTCRAEELLEQLWVTIEAAPLIIVAERGNLLPVVGAQVATDAVGAPRLPAPVAQQRRHLLRLDGSVKWIELQAAAPAARILIAVVPLWPALAQQLGVLPCVDRAERNRQARVTCLGLVGARASSAHATSREDAAAASAAAVRSLRLEQLRQSRLILLGRWVRLAD
eukprot:scaffold328920_cov52-Tisochrysis_lutea.AAC.9